MNYKVEIHNTFGFHKDIFLKEPIELWIDLLPNNTKILAVSIPPHILILYPTDCKKSIVYP